MVREPGREAELENFHHVLADISLGQPTKEARQFIIDAYVRGAHIGCAENCEFEGKLPIACRDTEQQTSSSGHIATPAVRDSDLPGLPGLTAPTLYRRGSK